MKEALAVTTSVPSDHRIAIDVPELPAGTAVKVVVLVPDEPTRHESVMQILASRRPGLRSHATARDVERFIRSERDSWDRPD